MNYWQPINKKKVPIFTKYIYISPIANSNHLIKILKSWLKTSGGSMRGKNALWPIFITTKYTPKISWKSVNTFWMRSITNPVTGEFYVQDNLTE